MRSPSRASWEGALFFPFLLFLFLSLEYPLKSCSDYSVMAGRALLNFFIKVYLPGKIKSFKDHDYINIYSVKGVALVPQENGLLQFYL